MFLRILIKANLKKFNSRAAHGKKKKSPFFAFYMHITVNSKQILSMVKLDAKLAKTIEHCRRSLDVLNNKENILIFL